MPVNTPKMIAIFTVIFLSGNSILAADICTSRASLILVDEFYMKQPFSSEVELDLSNYNEEFQSIATDAEKFASIAMKYDSEKELDELEPSPLIPFTPTINLIQVNSTQKEYTGDCNKLNAKVLEIEPHLIPLLGNILKTLEIAQTPIRTFVDRMKTVINPHGSFLKTANPPTAEEITKMQDYFPLIDPEGSISYPGSAITEVTKLFAFCMKPNNHWDRKGPNRQKWLTTLHKILPSVSTAKTWGTIFTTVISRLPLQSSLYKQMTDKLVLNTPLPLTRICKFLQKYNNNLNWESSIPSDFNTFLEYVNDFKTVARLFKQKSVTTTTTTISPQPVAPSTILPLMSVASLDLDRLQRFINMDPSKVNITGSIETIPLFRHDNNRITARAVFQQYSETDNVKIYNVKPVIYLGSVTTVTHVIGTFKNFLASLLTPTPFGCTMEEEEDHLIKVCQGYTTPGLSQLSPELSLNCGSALASDDSESDFSKCPSQTAPHRPLAHRVKCHNSSVVLSSNKPLVIRIYCDNISKRPLKLENSPSYLNTDCEIRLVDKNNVEAILLPQHNTKFLQERELDVIVVTLSPVAVTRTTTSATLASTISNVAATQRSLTLQLNVNALPSWVVPVLGTLCGFFVCVLLAIIWCLCCKSAYCTAVRNKCTWSCCTSGPTNQQSTNCCCWSCRSSNKTASGDAVEMLEQAVIKNPNYTPNEVERQELRPLITENKLQVLPPRSAPASAPPEDDDFSREMAFRREFSKSNNALTETRNIINNQLVGPSSQTQSYKTS